MPKKVAWLALPMNLFLLLLCLERVTTDKLVGKQLTGNDLQIVRWKEKPTQQTLRLQATP